MNEPFTQLMKRAHFEVRSLIDDGYRLMFDTVDHQRESAYMFLRHCRNKHRVMVRVRNGSGEIFVDGRKRKDI